MHTFDRGGQSATGQPATAPKTKVSAGTSSADVTAAAGAREGLRMLKASITKDNYKQFGFDSYDQVTRATLGDGVSLFYVRADQLKDYVPGTDAGKLMIPTNRRLYPVLADGIGRLVMTIEYSDNQWKLVGFGQQDIASPLSKIKQDEIRHSNGPGASAKNYFVVQIPSMHLSFLAHSPPPGPGGGEQSKSQVTLVPLDSSDSMSHSVGFKGTNFLQVNPKFNPAVEGTKSANDVFKALAPQAVAAMKTDAPQ